MGNNNLQKKYSLRKFKGIGLASAVIGIFLRINLFMRMSQQMEKTKQQLSVNSIKCPLEQKQHLRMIKIQLRK